jgi:hypothetical protein
MRVIVNDRVNIRSALEDRAMERSLDIYRVPIRQDRLAVQIVFFDVVQRDQFGAAAGGQEEPVGPFRVSHADMAIGIDDAFMRQDMVCRDQIL